MKYMHMQFMASHAHAFIGMWCTSAASMNMHMAFRAVPELVATAAVTFLVTHT